MLLPAVQMAAQVPVLDSVCSGAARNYRVDGESGSTYSWILTPPAGPAVTLPSDADTLQMSWDYPGGLYILQAVQHALNGCDALAVYGQVLIFEQPDVFAGPNALVCVGRYYKLVYSSAENYSALLWTTSGDGTFDDDTVLHPAYTPGDNDILAGTVTLTLTGYGLGFGDACDPSVHSMELAFVFEIIPQFEPIGPLCQFSIPPALPDTSLEGITGFWNPPIISTLVLGDFQYTFSPNDPAQCGIDTTIVITITSEILPQFEPIGPLCINSTPPALPDTSLEGITGTWAPPLISTDAPGTINYVFTPDDSTQCGIETDMDIAVVTEISPVFEPIGPFCQYSPAPALPVTSLNGISGTWEPPTIDTSVPGTFNYFFTADPDECGLDTTIAIIILPLVTPTFETIGPLCQYQAAPILPGTSLEGITGTWSPAWINTSTPGVFTYTFNPDPGQCGIVVTTEITIIEEAAPVFEPIGPLCQNTPAPELPGTSLNGITGTWVPPVINTGETGTFFFTFTPDTSYQCALPYSMMIIVVSEIFPEFDPIGPLCQNSMPPQLPPVSNNGITGSWDPTVIDTSVPGESTYIFTPDEGQCAEEFEMEIEITDEIMPEFDPVEPLCQGTEPPALPAISNNGITGTWDPAVINTTVPGTFTYAFTPDNPEQCGVETSMQVTIVTEIMPEFNPVEPLCQNSEAPDLRDISNNGIQGSWEPPNINTSEVGTFTHTFTPDEGQCAVPVTMDITIVNELTPVFDPIGPFCLNSPATPLPGSSLNDITGTWAPPVISTGETGTFIYTFTPDDGQCAVAVNMSIVVNDEITPVFAQPGPFCQGTQASPLPGTSLNGITGTWDPPVPNTSETGTSSYTFAPDEGLCAVVVSMEIEVLENVTPWFDPIGPLSQNSTPPLLPYSSNNTPPVSGTWNPPLIDTSVPGTFAYTFIPDEGQCAFPTEMNITVLFDYLEAITIPGRHCLGDAAIVPVEVDKFHNVAAFQLKLSYNVDMLYCEGFASVNPLLEDGFTGTIDVNNGIITLNWQSATPLTFTQIEVVTELVFTPKEPGQGELTWYTGPLDSYFYDLNGLSIPAEFFTDDLVIYQPPEILLSTSKTVCEGDSVTIYGIATGMYPPISYEWTYPDGSTHTNDPSFISVTRANDGYYTLLATDSLGCTDQKAIWLIVSENPVAAFHGSDTLTEAPGYILEAGSGQSSYLWNTGETSESITIDTAGYYWVEMVTHAGCTGKDSVYILISDEIPPEFMFIPNAFSPNGDGLNDTFKAVSGRELGFFLMQIYNRWGEKLFESSDISIGWDGKKNGSLCPADAYVYKIVYSLPGTPSTERPMIKTGAVVIVK